MTPTMDQLDSMGPQDVFDYVAAHLLRQGWPAVLQGGQCQYRAPDGSMCAVGCLIPDAYYDRAMEGHDVCDLAGYLHSTLSGRRLGRFMLRHAALLDKLQRVHDRCDSSTWRNCLVTVAARCGLHVDAVRHDADPDDFGLIVLRFALLPRDLLLVPKQAHHVVTQCKEAQEFAAA